MRTILRCFVWTIILASATAVAQTADGEIAGRIHDKAGAVLPGVRVTITSGDRRQEAVTNSEGRFVLRALSTGTYRVVAELAGFIPTAGEIVLSSSSLRAFLAWPLEAGCLQEVIRVMLGAREAAPLADAILHIRIVSVDGPVWMSVRPDCAGEVLQQYSVDVLDRAGPRGSTRTDQRQVFMPAGEGALESGHEYLALLSGDDATSILMLPIVSGLVASPLAGVLNGMPPDQALKLLDAWSHERR